MIGGADGRSDCIALCIYGERIAIFTPKDPLIERKKLTCWHDNTNPNDCDRRGRVEKVGDHVDEAGRHEVEAMYDQEPLNLPADWGARDEREISVQNEVYRQHSQVADNIHEQRGDVQYGGAEPDYSYIERGASCSENRESQHSCSMTPQ